MIGLSQNRIIINPDLLFLKWPGALYWMSSGQLSECCRPTETGGGLVNKPAKEGEMPIGQQFWRAGRSAVVSDELSRKKTLSHGSKRPHLPMARTEEMSE
jgi:hypothetical protein